MSLFIGLGLFASVGCNGRVVFENVGAGIGASNDSGTGSHPDGDAATAVVAIDAGADEPAPTADAAFDVQPDLAIDRSPDVTLTPDRPVEMPGTEVGTDSPRDATVDAGSVAWTPFVCRKHEDCVVPELRCLLSSDGVTGSCVECIGNADCPGPRRTAAAVERFCDSVRHRCVACSVNTDCPSPSDEYPSTCESVTRHCKTGCDDDTTGHCPATRRCDSKSYLCVECTTSAECATSPRGPFCLASEGICVQCTGTGANSTCPAPAKCDPLSGRCVECVSSKECLSPAKPLCNPVTLLCVAAVVL